MSDNNYPIEPPIAVSDRRRFYRRSEDSNETNYQIVELVSIVSDLRARIKTLEEEKKNSKDAITDIEKDIDGLKEVKSVVVAWSMVAGSVSAIIYTNFAAFKKLFE